MSGSPEQPHIGAQLARVGFGLLSLKARPIVLACIIGTMLLAAGCIFIAMISANFQHTTTVWPVPVATDTMGAYRAAGWAVSSQFGWRDDPLSGRSQFHDGIDLTNPQGTCPFGYHCGAPAMFDGQVRYVGWDQGAGDDLSKTGGGEVIILSNGQDDHQTIYAHLEPYRLYVQLEGKIEDSYDRDEYRRYEDYQTIGQGELKPDLSNGGIEMTCQNDMPSFIPTRTGGGSVVFLYDRPASCTTTVVWGKRGGTWEGWIPDEPRHLPGDNQRASLSWQTQITPGKRAKDVALRFRAHLVPPDPPPSPTALPTLIGDPSQHAVSASAPGGAAVLSGQGSVAAEHPYTAGGNKPIATPSASLRDGAPRSCEQLANGWSRCAWNLADIPTEQEHFAQHPDPWIVAALAASAGETATADDHEAGGVTIPLEQLYPTGVTAQPQPAATSTPTSPPAPRAHGRQVSLNGVGGPLRQELPTPVPMGTTGPVGTPAPIPTAPGDSSTARASISPSERVWVTAGASATWTLTLANNQRGFWSIQVSPADSRLSFSANSTCGASAGNSIVCSLNGSVTTLQLTTFTAPEVDGLIADIPVAISDADAGGSGVVVGALKMRIGVGTPPTATLIPPTATVGPTAPPGGGNTPDCAPQPLVQLLNVTAPQPRLVAPAAASFVEVRQEIVDRTGVDALAVLGDVLRAPSFTTSKPGVLQASWHKAGRAVDLNQGGPFVRVPEGNMFRLYVKNVDITAIFEAHGWRRIPVQGDTLEWWHYEYRSDGIAWTSAMLQVWDLPTLQAAFPEIAWETIGCSGGSNGNTDPTINPQERELMCVLAAPSFAGSVEYIDGCGPPVSVGDKVYQLDTTLGFVGLTGNTTGPHLHLGFKVRNYDGAWPSIDICTPEYLDGRTAPPDAYCYTDMADPISFLPLAPPPLTLGVAGQQVQAATAGLTPTPIIPEGAPYQLPPPNYPGSLFFTPLPAATPVGQYWSPFEDGGQYGGGRFGEWLCGVWSGWPWCR
jgi:murein DD-endopeptidase MepM/ murein hydrolase activator NlpD